MDEMLEKNQMQDRKILQTELLHPLEKLNPLGRIWIGLLLIVGSWGIFAYVMQLTHGLGVTAMRNYVSWGLYIATFVFYIGISHVGALLSAILRLTHMEWRRPLTRMAESITFASLIFGGMMPIIDMGRPDRLHHLVLYGRIQSPLIWDVLCILTYFAGSTLFLYIPAIPDIALCRDNFSNRSDIPGIKKWFYKKFSLGWNGTPGQWKLLEKCLMILTSIILPVAVSVHTVVSWIFAMTLRTGWNNPMFGPYFVAGALMSGAACVIIAMAVFRRFYHLEKYITERHFYNMGMLLFALCFVYIYFNINEYWVSAYKMETPEGHLLEDLFRGRYAPLYWTVQIGGLLLPTFILAFPQMRKKITLVVTASFLIAIGAWIKRYLIVIPTLLHPFLPVQDVPVKWADYFPTWVEWSITIGTFAGFLFLYTMVSRFIPIVSIWEMKEGQKIKNKNPL